MPSRDTFGLTTLEKCARSNVFIGNINLLPFDGPGGEGGQSRKFYTRRLLPEVQPLTLLCIFSDEKGPPILITSVESCYPFHEPSLQLCAPLSYNLPMHCL